MIQSLTEKKINAILGLTLSHKRGDNSNNRLTGDNQANKNDHILGWDGNDILYGNSGNDLIDGGTTFIFEHDVRQDSEGNVVSFIFSMGEDSEHGANNDDKLYGGVGNDILVGGHGDDQLIGGSGNDYLIGDAMRVPIEQGDPESTSEVTLNGNGNDVLRGEAGNDYLHGGGGDVDILDGGIGNDTLISNGDSALMLGGDGNDHLEGGADFNIMHGGAGNDNLKSLGIHDVLTGGAGRDTFDLSYQYDALVQILDFQDGYDKIKIDPDEGIGAIYILSRQAGIALDLNWIATEQGDEIFIPLGDGLSLTIDGVDLADLAFQHLGDDVFIA